MTALSLLAFLLVHRDEMMQGLVGAPACGDVMKLQIKVRRPAVADVWGGGSRRVIISPVAFLDWVLAIFSSRQGDTVSSTCSDLTRRSFSCHDR